MNLDKSTLTLQATEIEFNWERIRKKANLKREELVNNNPKVVKREIGRTQTTDSRIEPEIVCSTSNDNYPVITSSANAVVPDARADDGPDRNVIQIVKAIKEEQLTGKDLTVDERRIVVNSLRLSGKTQDAIADLLQVSRRTIVSDYKILRQQAALNIASKEVNEIGGEVYEVAKACVRKAMAAGKYKTVSTIMRDMVEVLQSMGLIYRAPKTSMQASLIGNLSTKQGYHKYMETIGDDKNKVVEVLDCMFNAITQDKL